MAIDNDFLGDAQILELSEKIHQAVLEHFHLVEQPYQGGPDFRFLYTTDQVKEAILKSIILTTQRVNPVYMYGSYGIGKSTIIQRLYALLRQEPRFDAQFIILHNKVTANSLIRDILSLFNIKTERSYDGSLKNLQLFLIGELPPEKSTKKDSKTEAVDISPITTTEKIPLLLIDEAQYLDKDALRLLHSLLNYESSRVKRIQIIIAGQEKLAENILKLGELASRMKAIQMYN
ncbi:MAG: AAA family ATPase, partial [Candidatus Levyibacteriota bacterium]